MQALAAMPDDPANQRLATDPVAAEAGKRGPAARHPSWLSDVLLTLGAVGLVLALVLPVIAAGLALSPAFVWRAAGLAAATGALILWFATTRPAADRFGIANRLTSVRAFGVALIAAFAGEPPAAASAWFIVAVAVVLLILDGVDGSIARRRVESSAFGARFDMETDAALTLVLAVLCWQFDKAGEWILAAGLMRYLFVAGAFAAPWLGRPLPYSRRRQVICVVQLSGLLAVLSPLFPVPASTLVGAVTVLLLAASFATDVIWLARCRSGEPEIAEHRDR